MQKSKKSKLDTNIVPVRFFREDAISMLKKAKKQEKKKLKMGYRWIKISSTPNTWVLRKDG